MYTARTDFIAHLNTGAEGLGIKTVKPYQGELREAAKNPTLLAPLMPAALVILDRGSRRLSKGTSLVTTLLLTRTRTLDKQENASDCLQLAEQVADWLEANFRWSAGGTTYSVDKEAGMDADTLMITNSYSVVQLTFVVKAV